MIDEAFGGRGLSTVLVRHALTTYESWAPEPDDVRPLPHGAVKLRFREEERMSFVTFWKHTPSTNGIIGTSAAPTKDGHWRWLFPLTIRRIHQYVVRSFGTSPERFVNSPCHQ